MNPQAKKFDTFGGVFTPTLLTILGVIMYLRLGWVVGNAGLLGAWAIIIVAFVITLTTALSMSSITTNIRIGAGGAYAIISQSLGLEVGGSLGIPRYISQGLAVTMYIFGFREGWLSVFPEHSAFLVDLLVFAVLYAIAYKSADLAIKTQYIIMGIICLSLAAIVFAAFYGSMQLPTEEVARWGTFAGSPEDGFQGADFWLVFAVFFPAATGIMAGANMSGELINPRRSIPRGTLAAIGVSFVIYMALAYWIARSATEEELLTNYNILIERSFWPPIMIAGVLGATFSSALGSIIGSSRILYAMGQHHVLPKGAWLAEVDAEGQPRNAMIITGILIFVTMMLRDLNAIAPLVSMFFLVTYAMLNVVVIIEQSLGLISFRPKFTIPRFVPWIGLVSSLFAMFIINPTVSLVSWALMFGVYGVLSRADLKTPFEDVRSGLFSSFSEWAAKHTAGLQHKQERSWKPNLLVPCTDAATVQGSFGLVRDIAFSKGSATLMGVHPHPVQSGLAPDLEVVAASFKARGVYSSVSVMRTADFAAGVNFGNQALASAFFRPNIIFLSAQEEPAALAGFPAIIGEAKALGLGLVVAAIHPRAMLGQQLHLNVWIERRPEVAWHPNQDPGNADLALLLAYKLAGNWGATVRLIAVIEASDERIAALSYLAKLLDDSRMPFTDVQTVTRPAHEARAPLHLLTARTHRADLNLFPFEDVADLPDFGEALQAVGGSVLWVRDSGQENVLA